MRGRLNPFQATMLRWRELHPYNAVHVVRVEAAFDEARAVAAIGAHLTEAGLTGLVIDRARRRYEYRGGAAQVNFTNVAGEGNARSALCTEIERQLNLPFAPDGAVVPFRFFALADGRSFHLGLAYDHFIAGGDSIAAMLEAVVARYTGAPTGAVKAELYPPDFTALFKRNPWAFVRGLAEIPRIVASCRRGARTRLEDPADGYNHFANVSLDPAMTAALLGQARAWGVTFNDILIALLLLAVAPLAAARLTAPVRRELAVASVVNLRGELGFDTRGTFGQFLSSMRISHPVPDGIGLEQLARDIHRETVRFKSRRLYLQTLVAMRYNGIIWRFLHASQKQRFYAKSYPVSAGLTTLNVNAIWGASGEGKTPPEYLRAVPTGPLAPLVVAATTAGNTIQLGLSYRRTAFTAQEIARIGTELTSRIRSLS